MIRLIAAAGFIAAIATSAQAITPAPLPQSDGVITQVRFGCGPLGHGQCVSPPPCVHFFVFLLRPAWNDYAKSSRPHPQRMA